MKKTIDEIDLSHYIYIGQYVGALVWQSTLEKDFGGDYRLLLDWCSAHIYTVDDPDLPVGEGHGIEKIDFEAVKRDYKKSLEVKNDIKKQK